MPGMKLSPVGLVHTIMNHLGPYESGYPILKELLQNADDARATRFQLDARDGWPDARNPLLQGPGLLIFNDGAFCQKDKEGILQYGTSVKAGDDKTIGKFGSGRQEVFHLCDAFAVHACGPDGPFSFVVNPFKEVEGVEEDVKEKWEDLESDVHLLKEAADFPKEKGFILWLPFRRDGLLPLLPDRGPSINDNLDDVIVKNRGFSSNKPDIKKTVQQMKKPDDLRSILTALRHLEVVDIREEGKTCCVVRVRGKRLLGPGL